ncbi:Vimentin [Camelus dromedarius]|uniref:Vimentin n=1 Tax=Camelus dromedarius TaxID=9838 RepID=A0A5N4DWF0_CAMDR|nr:Vimentin [Camelus dromedarius]
MQLWKKLQEEMLQRGAQREETQSTLGTFRQDVDTVSLALLDLERKVDSLQEETDFLKKLHNDESALCDVRQENESVAAKNLQKVEEQSKSKFADLCEVAN